MELLEFNQLPLKLQNDLKSKEVEKIHKSINDMGLTFESKDRDKHTIQSYIREQLNWGLYSQKFVRIENTFYKMDKIGMR